MEATDKPEKRLVNEFVWLPTYLSVFLLVIAAGGDKFYFIFPALILSRFILEMVYRLTFGNRRHELKVKCAAFASQCALWGFLWWFYGVPTR